MPGPIDREARHVLDLVVVDPGYHYHVDLHRFETRGLSGPNPGKDLPRVAAAADAPEALGAQGGGHREIVDARQPRHASDQLGDTAAHERFPAGDPDPPQTERAGDGVEDPLDFVEGQDLLVRQHADTGLGHAVQAAQIAAIGDRKPQIGDDARVRAGF